jgi:hypothetical protein
VWQIETVFVATAERIAPLGCVSGGWRFAHPPCGCFFPHGALGASSSRQAEKHCDGPIEAEHCCVIEVADMAAEFVFPDGRELVSHQPGREPQAVCLGRLDRNADQRSGRRVRRDRADCHRLSRIETIILYDHHGPRLACIVGPARDSPNLSTSHLLSQNQEIESTKA